MAPGEVDLPRQEPGQRPARPLPYALQADGEGDDDGRLWLDLSNQGEAAAAFPRLMLHACHLVLPHPDHGKPIEFHSPTPF